jgi:hypothetical protein
MEGIWVCYLPSLFNHLLTLPRCCSRNTGTFLCRGEEIVHICVERARSVPIEAAMVIGQITDESPNAAVPAEPHKIILEKSSQITFLCVTIITVAPS